MTRKLRAGSALIDRLRNYTKIDGECWRWTGAHKGGGYGAIRVDGRLIGVHRVSAHIHHGLDLRSDLMALHKRNCPNRDCWNPAHLYVGTKSDNTIDSIAMGTWNRR